MALGNLFKSLLGSGSSQPQPSEPIDYKGFTIETAPLFEDGKYRTAGFISGEIDGEVLAVDVEDGIARCLRDPEQRLRRSIHQWPLMGTGDRAPVVSVFFPNDTRIPLQP